MTAKLQGGKEIELRFGDGLSGHQFEWVRLDYRDFINCGAGKSVREATLVGFWLEHLLACKMVRPRKVRPRK